MKEVSTISKRKSRSRPQNRRQQPRPVNKGYGDAGASWHKKATKGFRAMSGSPKEDIDANNYTLRQRARMLYMAAPIATSAIRTNRTNVVGIGLQLKSRIDREALGMTQEAADAWQAQAEREFALWSENKRACDATGVNNFAAMQQLALSSWLVSGDVFAVVKQYEPTPLTPYSLRLHLIEADRVATPTTSGIITPMLLTTGRAANGNTIYDGVEVNDDGQIEAYHIRSTYPFELGSTTTTWARVQAYGERTGLPNILHVMESERPDQYRGVSYLAQVIEPLLQLRRYTESELTAAVVESFFTAFIKTEAGAGDNPFNEVGSSLPEVSRDPNEYEMGPGQINIMEPGEDVAAFINNDITTAGLIVLAKGVAGQKINYTKIVLGDGYLEEGQTPRTLTGVVSPKATVDITKLKINGDGTVAVGGIFANGDETEGFYYRELGLYAEDPDPEVGEVLYCYGNCGDLAEWIPPSGGATIVEKTIDIVTAIGTATNVTAYIPADAYATKEDYETYKAIALGAQATAEEALALARQAIAIAQAAEASVNDLSNAVGQNTSKIATLWDAVFSEITTNPFQITFADLTGITLTAGIWNSGLQRLEC